jgi:hypothetical protein
MKLAGLVGGGLEGAILSLEKGYLYPRQTVFRLARTYDLPGYDH